MKSGSSSQTAMMVAMPRAIHQLIDDEPRVLDDPVAVHMVPGFSRENVLSTLNAPNPILDYRSPMMTLARANLIMRARFAEDCLHEAINAGVWQYVILGAGFDTFAYRQPSWGGKLRVFEVDHPATQRIKRNRLSTAGIKIPGNVSYCGCDFEQMSLSDALASTQFDTKSPTFFSWLGVTVYLTVASIDTTLRYVASLPAGTTIVFDGLRPVIPPSGFEIDLLKMIELTLKMTDEPLVTDPEPREWDTWLKQVGFSRISHLTPEEATARYFAFRDDVLGKVRREHARSFGEIMTATV